MAAFDQKGFIIDLDGTVYLQDKLIPGAVEAINQLYEKGHKICFLTNNPTKQNAAYYHKLKDMGIKTVKEDILSGTYLSALFLKRNMQEGDLFWSEGEDALTLELKAAGLPMASSPEMASKAVLGGGPSFSFDYLNNMFQAYLSGAEIYAVNPDPSCPVENQLIPDTGAWVAAMHSLMAEGEKIEIIGKPSKNAAETVIQYLNLPPEKCFVIGDRMETDILMAQDFGMNSILVLSGVTKKEDLLTEKKIKPDYVLTDISELSNLKIV
jgi:arabinose operon protein AraL